MGAWGVGLYSGDFAQDLRGAIRAVARLPFDNDRLVDILCETEPTAANKQNDEDHTTFWLVVADQFSKRGIACDRVRDKAIAIIDGGSDLAMLEKLGMDPSGLKKRRQMLDELRLRLAAPVGARRGSVLKKPQAFLMDVGDVLVYPTCGGRCINPYFASKDQQTYWGEVGSMPWKQDGWGALVIVDRGRAFDFLSWYRPLKIAMAMDNKPTVAELGGELLWKLPLAGTCSAVHFKRMELEKIGALAIDPDKFRRTFPNLRPATAQAISDISIANQMETGPSSGEIAVYNTIPKLIGIDKILTTAGWRARLDVG
jgi:hypothetical protein